MANRFDWLDAKIPKVAIPAGASGRWRVEVVDIPDSFTARVRERDFAPGRFTQLWRGGTLVMSDTPAERLDHLPFVRAARGHVVIGGLGLGMCLGAVLLKPEVTAVTALEISPDVIALVAPHYGDPRVRIIEADARTWTPPKGERLGAAWFDIWDGICRDNLREMTALNRRYGRRADWHGNWAEELARELP
jgi:hypothetical protein